jgi:hypothetical protein
MLLDLPGTPCDVMQTRTMSQRLRKAQECAAAGGKYGLVQAVLLSLDSQPACPAHWLRTAIALEACSKVLLPAAHEGQVDLGAARAAYQQLTPAEQRLWRQLQAARIQWGRDRNTAPVCACIAQSLGPCPYGMATVFNSLLHYHKDWWQSAIMHSTHTVSYASAHSNAYLLVGMYCPVV